MATRTPPRQRDRTEDAMWIFGYAARFGTASHGAVVTNLDGTTRSIETVLPGAFNRAVVDQWRSDTYLTLQHAEYRNFAHVKARSLRLEQDSAGLFYAARIDDPRGEKLIRRAMVADAMLGVSVQLGRPRWTNTTGGGRALVDAGPLPHISLIRAPLTPAHRGTSIIVATPEDRARLARGQRPSGFAHAGTRRRAGSTRFTTGRIATRDPGKPGDPISFTAATEGRKPDGVDLRMDRADLSRYRRNPVFLYGHTYTGRDNLPIGRASRVGTDGPRLLADIIFDQDDPFARQVESKYRRGILNAVSVGFDAHNLDRDGVPERWELLEISAVPIPLDPDATAIDSPPRADLAPIDLRKRRLRLALAST